MSEVKCYNCNEMGHFARDCPEPNKREIKANLAKREDDDQGLLMAEVCDTIKTVVEKPTREVLLQEEKMVPKLSGSQDVEGPTTKMEHKLKVRALRTDRGGEFTSNEFNDYCEKIGIKRFLTTPYTPQQNGVVERHNRTVVDMARSLLKSKNMQGSFWGEAVTT